ncbi:MAG: ABC transporter ATP-binding protein [Clostridia bacterium]|nr:ABC transporter ATP-binding protein [Clostridia bacterium]
MSERLLEIDHVSKQYRLGSLGGRYLYRDINSWIARKLGREDPNRKIGVNGSRDGETFLALDDINFTVDRGDALALVGRNGAGKSTMLKLISRITAPTTGEIRIHGRVASLLEVGTGFHYELTGRENVYLNGAILGMSRQEISRKMDEIVEFSEIDKFIDTPVKRYSSGMYVKLGFAVAANLAPDILVCDEVLAVGDLTFQQKCLNKMSDVARSGRAVLYVSHNMRTVSQLCSRALFLDHGKLLYDGTTERAIELYGGAGNRDVVRDLNSMTRPRNRGETMRMLKLTVLNSLNMEYQMDEDMEFSIHFKSNLTEKNVRLRLILKTSVAAPIGMTQTRPFDVEAGKEYSYNIRFPLAGLGAGEYMVKLSLISDRIGGGSNYFDTIEDIGQFIVLDDPGMNSGFTWEERLWGNMRLGSLDIF